VTRQARAPRRAPDGPREIPIPRAAAARVIAAEQRVQAARATKQEVVNAVLETLGCDIDRDDGLVWTMSNETGQMVARLGPPESELPIAGELREIIGRLGVTEAAPSPEADKPN
jgi:hypothetical protein